MRDLPEGFGNWSTVYGRHRRWSLDGTWAKFLDVLRAGCDAEGREWAVSADSTVVRAHQPAAGARRALPAELARGALANDKNPQATGANPAKLGQGREALGRSRGGLTTKIHLAADRRCRPLARILTPGQHGDCPQFIPLMNQLAIRRRGVGRPRTRPGAAMADKAYSSAANRAYLRKRGIKTGIPVKEDQKNNRRVRGRRRGAALRVTDCSAAAGQWHCRAEMEIRRGSPQRTHQRHRANIQRSAWSDFDCCLKLVHFP